MSEISRSAIKLVRTIQNMRATARSKVDFAFCTKYFIKLAWQMHGSTLIKSTRFNNLLTMVKEGNIKYA